MVPTGVIQKFNIVILGPLYKSLCLSNALSYPIFLTSYFFLIQNNLHELWSLLNFLLPEIFSSAETFDEWFQISGENDQQEVVQQLHKVQ